MYSNPTGTARPSTTSDRAARLQASGIAVDEPDDEVEYVNFGGVLTEVLADGKAYMMFRNPYPTTQNKFLSGLANGLANVAVGIGTAAVAAVAAAKAGEMRTKEIMEESENRDVQRAVVEETKTQAHVLHQFKPPGNVSGFKYYKTEFMIFNKHSGSAVSVHEKNFEDGIRTPLMGCGRFLMMGKRAQKKRMKFDRLGDIVAYLNECYQG